jgi:hypothetical protein
MGRGIAIGLDAVMRLGQDDTGGVDEHGPDRHFAGQRRRARRGEGAAHHLAVEIRSCHGEDNPAATARRSMPLAGQAAPLLNPAP